MWNLIRSALREARSGGLLSSPGLEPADALFVLSAAHFNLQTAHGLVCDKVQLALREISATRATTRVLLNDHPAVSTGTLSTPAYTTDRAYIRAYASAAAKGVSRSRAELVLAQRLAFYGRLLDKVKPRIVVGVGLKPPLCSAATRRGIPTVELQHGLLAPSNIGAYWPSGLIEGSYPDLLLTWDDFYTDAVTQHGIPARSVGYPSLLGEFAADDGDRTQELGILVTLQHRLPSAADPFGTVGSGLYKSLKHLSERRDVRLIIRLHPVSEKSPAVADLVDWLTMEFPTAEVLPASSSYVLQDLARSDLHVTFYSSTCFEAALMGVPSVQVADLQEMHMARAALDALPPQIRQPPHTTLMTPDQFGSRLAAGFVSPGVYTPVVTDSLADVLRELMDRATT